MEQEPYLSTSQQEIRNRYNLELLRQQSIGRGSNRLPTALLIASLALTALLNACDSHSKPRSSSLLAIEDSLQATSVVRTY